MSIGYRIKKIRKEMKLTQDEFASKLKLHPKQLSKYESGRSTPILEILSRIAKFCEVSTDYLIFGEDNKLAGRIKISDLELIELFQQLNRLKKSDRDKIKWVIKSVLNSDFE